MAKPPELITKAKTIAENLEVSVCAWGKNNICFNAPKSADKLETLKAKLSEVGLNPVEDSDDEFAGLITFADKTFHKVTNPYFGKMLITPHKSKFYYYLSWAFYIGILIPPVFLILSNEHNLKVIGVVSLILFLSILRSGIKTITSQFILNKNEIIYKNIFKSQIIKIADISSIQTVEGQKASENIIFKLKDHNVIKTPSFSFIFARRLRDALKEHIKQNKD